MTKQAPPNPQNRRPKNPPPKNMGDPLPSDLVNTFAKLLRSSTCVGTIYVVEPCKKKYEKPTLTKLVSRPATIEEIGSDTKVDTTLVCWPGDIGS